MDSAMKYYASKCGGGFGVFNRAGFQVGGWWPSLAIAEQVASLLNKEVNK
jgi:hypothetical protein